MRPLRPFRLRIASFLAMAPFLLLACGGDDAATTSAPGAGAGGAAGTSGGGTSGGKAGAGNGASAGAAGTAAGKAGTAGAAGSFAGASGAAGTATGGQAGGGAAGSASGAAGSTSGGGGVGGSASGAAGAAGSAASGAAGASGSTATAGSAGAAGSTSDPCVGLGCQADERCVVTAGVAACVELVCADLTCKADENCIDPANGGAFCSPKCASDLACPTSQFCQAGLCVDDVCTPGSTSCAGSELKACEPNGGGIVTRLVCGSPTMTSQTCTDPGNGDAFCGCSDDWDCPANTVCVSGACEGTGKAPTCSLAPVSFTQVLPKTEVHWGGLGSGVNNSALGAPFPASSQVSVTPIVANLDDDNGDGKIDERDTPEIVFMTYCNSEFTTNGVVRAIHGGGAAKGKDYFAECGATVWHEGDPLDMPCVCANAVGNSTSALAVADLDADGIPEIVVVNEDAGVRILDNRGVLIVQSAGSQWTGYPDPAVTIANLDGAGLAEIIIGRDVFTLGKDAAGKLVFVDHFAGSLMRGLNTQGPIACVADLAGTTDLEIIAGTTVYAMPKPPAGVTRRAQCAVGATDDFCAGKLTVVWDGQTVNGAAKIANAQRDGFCAIADVLGADAVAAPSPSNPLDGKPEVVLIAEGYLLVLDGATGVLQRSINLGAGNDGGAPNVDDFDGDGFPEIGTAFGSAYLLVDLQTPTAACPAWPNAFDDDGTGPQGNPPRDPGGACTTNAQCNPGAVCNVTAGTCTCLHSGWRRRTEDDSSRVTGSSVFDFNGDGAAEVVYGDECWLRVYDGASGNVLFKQAAPSRTRIENPVVADVDNDGNAEIVNATNNDVASCSTGVDHPNGITVWGDSSDAWVSARRIWNQHAYHVTNITESGSVPVKEPASWQSYNGRTYNVYRSQPRSFGVAPDVVVSGIQLTSPGVACGQLSSKLVIATQVTNEGDLRVGAGIPVTFYGEWESPPLTAPLYADNAQTPLTAQLPNALEPGDSVILNVSYDAANNAPGVLPNKVRVVVDEKNDARECRENNNETTANVTAGEVTADLTIAIGTPSSAACPTVTVSTTITNGGSAPATDVRVRYFAGDPDQGGKAIHTETFAGVLAAFGGTVTRTVTIPSLPSSAAVTVYARVDPENEISECNDGNNTAVASTKVACGKD